jgi:hypothetical protein
MPRINELPTPSEREKKAAKSLIAYDSERPRRWASEIVGTLHFKMQHADQRRELEPSVQTRPHYIGAALGILKVCCPFTSAFYIGTLQRRSRLFDATGQLTPVGSGSGSLRNYPAALTLMPRDPSARLRSRGAATLSGDLTIVGRCPFGIRIPRVTPAAHRLVIDPSSICNSLSFAAADPRANFMVRGTCLTGRGRGKVCRVSNQGPVGRAYGGGLHPCPALPA